MALALPFDPAESVAATRLAWAIERYADGELTADQVEATHEFDPGYGVEQQLMRFRIFRRPIDEVLSFEPSPTGARATVRSGQDTAIVSVRLSGTSDQRILMMSLMKCPAPGVTTRHATDADGPTLRDLERRSAVETGGVSVYYDRGDDYFAQQRLMPQHFSSVAEYENRIVGVSSDALCGIRVAGTEYRATYRFHLRIDPGARGLGILPALNASQSALLMGSGRPLPIAFMFVAAENEQMLAAAGPEQNAGRWETRVERLVIPCRSVAGPPFGRPAEAQDAPRIADLLSASHAAEELALGFDAAWVEERLTRSPRDYSFGNVILSGCAVLGVWDSGLRMVRKDAGGSVETRTATVLDWGFEPGAEAEMESLIRSACSTLASAGVDDLVTFSSPPSRGRVLLAGLARSVEPFLVRTGGLMPRDDARNGVYVDPIYF